MLRLRPQVKKDEYGVVRAANSAATVGSPLRNLPPGFSHAPDGQYESQLAMAVARIRFPNKVANGEPYMFTNPSGLMCYRNSVIALLLNIDAYLGFLQLYHQIAPASKSGTRLSILSYLNSIAEAYWLPGSKSYKSGIEDDLMPRFWKDFNTIWQWNGGDGQQDADDFLHHLWARVGETTSDITM
jgi:hypothetical protein